MVICVTLISNRAYAHRKPLRIYDLFLSDVDLCLPFFFIPVGEGVDEDNKDALTTIPSEYRTSGCHITLSFLHIMLRFLTLLDISITLIIVFFSFVSR